MTDARNTLCARPTGVAGLRAAVPAALVACLGAATLAFAQPLPPEGGPQHGQGVGPGPVRADFHRDGHGPVGLPGLPPLLAERQLDSVGASAEQKAKVHDIYKAAHDEVTRQFDAQRALHGQLANLLTAPQIDSAAIEVVRQKLAAGHDAATKRLLQASIDASTVLSPEQRQKLAEQIAKRQELSERHHREWRALEAPRS